LFTAIISCRQHNDTASANAGYRKLQLGKNNKIHINDSASVTTTSSYHGL